MPDDTLVIGLGNRDRGDDGIGIAVAEHAAELSNHAFRPLLRGGDPLALLDDWAGREHVVIVDAVRSGDPAGTIRRIDAICDALPVRGSTSSHGAGLGEAIELARTLGRLPRRLLVLGIEAGELEAGAALSPACRAAIDDAARLLLAELEIAAVEEGTCTSTP